MDNVNQNLDPNYIPEELKTPYDIIELPSQGILYKNNKKSVKVEYLTAMDESILTSPNIASGNKVINILLERGVTIHNDDERFQNYKQSVEIHTLCKNVLDETKSPPRGDHDSRHRVVVGMEDWIKLVIMATSTADGLGEKSLGKHVDLLVDDVDQHFFFVGFCEDLWPQR